VTRERYEWRFAGLEYY